MLLSRALLALSQRSVARSLAAPTAVRAFSVSALRSKTAVAKPTASSTRAKGKKTAGKSGASSVAAAPKRSAKPKRAAKPKKAAAKKAKKEPSSKSALLETLIKVPKGAPTAYGLFVKDMWFKTKSASTASEAAQPADVFMGAAREISHLWRTLGDAEKQRYVARADALSVTNEQRVREWWASVDSELVALENKRRRRYNRRVASKELQGRRLPLLRNPLAPKRPDSAYTVFIRQGMANLSDKGLGLGEQAKALGAQWSAMSDAAKAPFVVASAASVQAYKTALAR
ncbi:hypothetical protein GGI04_003488 [Coemansia thaxteri]|nr:hypothetical protein GGI04_003488 [Coemansia thaxteri]